MEIPHDETRDAGEAAKRVEAHGSIAQATELSERRPMTPEERSSLIARLDAFNDPVG